MNHKTLMIVALLVATTFMPAGWAAHRARTASASALAENRPALAYARAQAESPLKTPAGVAPVSPLDTPDAVAPESPLTTRGAAAPQSPLTTPAFGAALSPDSLANLTYLSSYGADGTVTLDDGEYSRPTSPGAASRDTVTFLPEHTAYGVLAGLPAAAVVLRSSGGGSGNFYDLAIVLERDSEPVNIAGITLGDRIHIFSTDIIEDQIVIDMVTHGPRDPACCPTQHVVNTYELRDAGIVEISRDVIGTVLPESVPAEGTSLEGSTWVLSAVRNADDEMFDAVPDRNAFIRLEENVASGDTGCNSLSGRYTISAHDDADEFSGDIDFDEVAVTAMACQDPLAVQEQNMVNALGNATTYMITDDTLRIYDDFGYLMAEYVVAPHVTIDGAWSATRYQDTEGEIRALIDETTITAVFDSDGTLSGNAGCNNYTSSYTLTGSAIEIAPPASTRMMCNEPDGIMQQEQAYLAALPTAAVYSSDIDTLQLRTADGASVAVYRIETGQDESICNADVAGNIAYAIDAIDGPFLLQDGAYKDEASRITAEILPDIITCGDVTGDDKDDALVPIWANTGGTGVFVYLTLIGDEGGEPANVASVLLGDRIKIDSITIGDANADAAAGEPPLIRVEMINHGLEDAMCCPSQQAVNMYQWSDGELVELSSEVVEGLTPVKLANMPYQVDDTETGTAWLMRGIYEEPTAPTSSLRKAVMLVHDSAAFGDIEGVPSAAVVLVAQLDGETTKYYLALVQQVDGRPEHVASALLGDRALINTVTFEDDEIVVDMVVQGPDDPQCCPATRTVNRYQLEDDNLIEIASEVSSKRGRRADNLIGPVWQWQRSVYGNDTEAIPDDPTSYTLEFIDDGSVAATIDCHRGSGQYEIDGASISIELLTATRAACPEDSLDEEFVRDVNGAAIHFFQDGDLYLDIQMDSGTMHFSK